MQGQKSLERYLRGERLTMKQMILAKCYDCMGKYIDGRDDCGIADCSLYPLMPYGKVRRRAVEKVSSELIPASSPEVNS